MVGFGSVVCPVGKALSRGCTPFAEAKNFSWGAAPGCKLLHPQYKIRNPSKCLLLQIRVISKKDPRVAWGQSHARRTTKGKLFRGECGRTRVGGLGSLREKEIASQNTAQPLSHSYGGHKAVSGLPALLCNLKCTGWRSLAVR